ncbi:MAG: O-methyltransferase [Polaribacter sp.]
MHLFKEIKQRLLAAQKKIKTTDFSADYQVFKNDKCPSKKTKIARISLKKAKLLIRITQYFKPEEVLEIGTSLELVTSALKIGYKNAKIITLEDRPKTSKIATELLQNRFKNIEIVTGNFGEILPKITNNNKFDFIYFDKNHTKIATIHYFETYLETVHNDSVWIFDAIYRTQEMQEVWQMIKNHPKVTVTVDVFYLGIVFFRKEQAKEHFKIRV